MVFIIAPYGTQSAANMQGYSGQPIFYPNPAPQVLVQQAYPNLPVSSVCLSYFLSYLCTESNVLCIHVILVFQNVSNIS